jgi:squalene-associated FAD-dependent desaturase
MKKLGYLSATDRRSIGRAIKRLAKTATDGQFADWLQSEKQSQAALDLFWSVFVHGALGDTLENVSISAAKKVFVDGFLSHRDAGDLILSGVPLSEIFDVRVAKYLTERGVKIHRRERVEWIEADDEQQLSLVMPDGDVRPFDAVILAVAWHQASNLFPPTLLDELPELESAQKLSPGSIISVHLYFDRPITALPHAILPGKLSQWIFRTAGEKQTSYQVVISAAHRLAPPEKDALLALVLEELETVFPDVKSANLLHSRVVVQPQAIFTMTPGVEKLRPSQTASLKNLFFAGDWTDTAWPATMEGAVRSGYAALEKLLRSLDQTDKILAPDLPKGFFSKKFLGPR